LGTTNLTAANRRPQPATRTFSHLDLTWDGLRLRLGRGRVLATIEADQWWPRMFRVRVGSAPVSDMVNVSRARDAAVSLALASLNAEVA
jgi:hypothetical protein